MSRWITFTDNLWLQLTNSAVLINPINFVQGSKWTRRSETRRLYMNGNPMELLHIPIFYLYQMFILVSIDYFTMWIETASFAFVTKNVVALFIKQNLIYRYGIP